MTNFMIDYATKNVEKLIDKALKELRYICCFTCIAEEFEEEKVWLEAERTEVGQRVEVAKRRGENVQLAYALFWKGEVDKIIQEDTKTKQKCFFGLCPHCIWRYKRGKELANKKQQIIKLTDIGKTLAIGLPAPLPDVERYSSRNYIAFKSRVSKYNELLDALKEENNYIIGLQGMGGTGKTTLAKEVGKILKQSKQFTCIIVTTVSFSPDIKKIQDDIAGPLGLKFDDCSESDRPKKLWKRLTDGEKILLILDDVWGDIDFEEIGIPHSDNHKGCRVLITTRSVDVCNTLGCSKTIRLELLSKDDAWEMFKRHAGLTETSSKILHDKGRKIADKCKGLPIAIAVIGSSLKGKQDREEWDVALNSLQKYASKHEIDDGDYDLVKIYECLKFSYDKMNDEKAKRLFLLCSVFREDEEISTEILIRIGIGAGLFGENYGNYKDARSQVVISKNKLINSCLLLEVHHNTVKMHDLVRDAAQWIAKKEIQTIKLYDKNQKAMVGRENNIKYLLCEGNIKDVLSCKIDSPKLQILIVTMHKDGSCHDEETEVPKSFFENISGLRVFHFVVEFYQENLSLPQSIQSLKNIRYLLFKGVDLGDISILGSLQSLETLDLDSCKINELPEGLAKLHNLRLLKLIDCEIKRNNPFKVIEGCSSLEELYFAQSFNDCCREISLPMLQRYILEDDVRLVNGSLSKCVSLLHQQEEHLLSEKQLKECIQEAEVLKLTGIWWEWVNIIPEIVSMDHGMNDLVKLKLRHISQLKCLIDTKHGNSKVTTVFSNLVVLLLVGMECLEVLCNGPLSFDSMKSLEDLFIMECNQLQRLFMCNLNLCNLKSLFLIECPMLISLFELTTSRSLVSLEQLTITGCKKLECIIIDERKEKKLRGEINDDDSKRSHDSIMFPKLKSFYVEGCCGLQFILSFLTIQCLPALESLSIFNCENLQYIFGQYVQLGSLKHLNLWNLPNLINIFPKSHPTTPSISRDASKPEKQSEPMKGRLFLWTDICCFGKKHWQKSMSTASTKISSVSEDQQQDCLIASESNSYSLKSIWERVQCLLTQTLFMWNIKKIELDSILKIESIFILSIAPRILLETLIIRNCNELKHIIIDTGVHESGGNNWHNVFPKLKIVEVEGCMKLEYLFEHYSDEIHIQLPALERLYLCNLPRLIATCPKHNSTTFPLLKELDVSNCLQFEIKSIGDLTIHSDSTINKDLTTETTSLLVGPKNPFSLNHFTRINIVRCEKLEIVFSTSILRCLPQLLVLRIEECKELKHVIEDDLENDKSINFQSTKTYFPKLEILAVVNCNKLKCVFQTAICNELPKLKVLVIREAYELREIFKIEGDDQKLETPNLEMVAFINLPELCHAQGVHFKAVKHRLVQNCHKLSLTSTSKSDGIDDIHKIIWFLVNEDIEFFRELVTLLEPVKEVYKGHDTCNENPSSEITQEFTVGVAAEAAPESGSILTSSHPQVLMNEQSMDQQLLNMNQQHFTSIKPQLDGSTTPEKNLAANSSSISETKKEPPIQLSALNTLSSSTHSKTDGSSSDPLITSELKPSSQKDGDCQIAMPSLSNATTNTNDEVSLNADTSMKVSSNIEEQYPKDDKIIVSKSKPSPTITSPIASQFPLVSFKGELEQLVSKKYMYYENLSLLTDFLATHPSVILRDTSLSNRYKGYAYNCLAELLKFLQTHSVLDVLGSNNSEFVELLQDVRKCCFDKEWLDGIERRALFPDIQVSPDTLQKLLDSKQQAVSKEVEVLRLKIAILSQCAEDLNQQLTDLKQQLTSSEAVLESIIQQKTVLSAPIGY